jgi:membrane fusion protein (multidrug efflux system)
MKKFKPLLITILCLIVVVGILVTIRGLQIGRMVAQGKALVPPPETVTAAPVIASTWESLLTAVGSLQAVQGVTVSAELAGRVTRIAFESGTRVDAGNLLVQLDISAELAQQQAAQSDLLLARKNFDRASALLADKIISKSSFDDSKASYDRAVAQLDNIRAAIAKKTIKAPFGGRLGIRQINLGETLTVGQPIVSLQSLDPIYVNFHLPQQQLTDIRKGLPVRVTTGASDGRKIPGTITAINSEVDSASRNIRVQATLGNQEEALRPGMYVEVAVVLPARNPVLAIPATAVLYAPYSDSVFVVEENLVEENKEGKAAAAGLVVRQQFVELGEKQGDFVAVHSGLKPGETVVSTGVFKLRNGQSVVVDNSISPEFRMAPDPDNA